jgi:endonuclease III
MRFFMISLQTRDLFPIIGDGLSKIKKNSTIRAMASTSAKSAPGVFKLIQSVLLPLYPDQGPLLHYSSPFELLVAVTLSAQCTDDRVNQLTPLIFRRWPDSASLARADRTELEAVIRPAGFYHSKAGYLIGSARMIEEKFGGKPPFGMEELTSLPGIGRKSAHVIRSACADLPGIIVDTHVIRVMNRLGAVQTEDPFRIETEIATYIPEEEWTAFSHAVNRHGKYVCRARSPECEACPLAKQCPYRKQRKRS